MNATAHSRNDAAMKTMPAVA
ncbi:MAG: hypothetical protein QOJ95_5833, partial [Mycobacterium sp.]|nr:hypothetical protein [Mycobacterium sp.]